MLRARLERGEIAAREIQRPPLRFEHVERSDAGAAFEQLDAEITEAGAEIGRATGKIGRQVLGEQLRGDVDPVPGEHAGPADEPAVGDRPRRIQLQPFVCERCVLRTVQRRSPERTAFVLRQRRDRAGDALRDPLRTTARLRYCWRTRGFARPARSHESRARAAPSPRRVVAAAAPGRAERIRVAASRSSRQDAQIRALERGGIGLKGLLADETGPGARLQRRAGPGTNEQRSRGGPREVAVEERQEQCFERLVSVRSAHIEHYGDAVHLRSVTADA